MDLDNEIAKLTAKFAALMQKRPANASHDELSLLGIRIVTLVYYHDAPYTMKELAQAAGILMPSASVMVEKLEDTGYLERRHSHQDRRVIHVYLTAKTKNMIQDSSDRSRSALKRALAGLNEADKQVVIKFFDSYTTILAERESDKG